LYMEDAPVMHTYNYEKKGFADPPTDYYLRPYYLAMDSKTKDYCYLGRVELEVCLIKLMFSNCFLIVILFSGILRVFVGLYPCNECQKTEVLCVSFHGSTHTRYPQ
jgi:Protein of unknown function (DUF229)